MNPERLHSLILQLQGAIDGKTRRTGSSTATWTAAIESANKTIPHGLGVTPTHVTLTAVGTGALLYSVVSVDATNIVVKGRDTRDTNLTGTFSFTWEAIG